MSDMSWLAQFNQPKQYPIPMRPQESIAPVPQAANTRIPASVPAQIPAEPRVANPQEQAPPPDVQMQMIEKLKAAYGNAMKGREGELSNARDNLDVMRMNMGSPQLDLSPLMALAEAESGKKVGYNRPPDASKKLMQMEALRRGIVQEQRGISQDQMKLLHTQLAGQQKSEEKELARGQKLEKYDHKQIADYGRMKRGVGRGGALLKQMENRDLALNKIFTVLDEVKNGRMVADVQTLRDLSGQLSQAATGAAPQLSQIEATDYLSAQRSIASMKQWGTGVPKQAATDEILEAIYKQAAALKKGVAAKYRDLQADLYNTQIKSRNYDEKYPSALEPMMAELERHITFNNKGHAVSLDRAKGDTLFTVKGGKVVPVGGMGKDSGYDDVKVFQGKKYGLKKGKASNNKENWEILK